MEIALITSVWRFAATAFGMGIFIWIEIFSQLRTPKESRIRHYLRNLSLGLGNGLALHIAAGGAIAAYYSALAENGLGILNALGVGSAGNVLLSFVFLDFITYAWHRAYHKIPVLWRIHRVHHSDLDLDVTSASRFHITEIALSSALKMLVGLLWGPSALALVVHETLLGAAAQFHHSNIRLPERWESRLRRVVVTPKMHHIHHSNVIGETNSNYSNFLSIWDTLFGTRVNLEDENRIIYGLWEYPEIEDVTLRKMLLMPLDPPCGDDRRGDGRGAG
ncbi:MAG: sterol desaturase family protein [Deltaproteobacteria bacterium]